MSESESIKLKNLVLKIGSGATPRGGGNSYKGNGIPLIRSQNVLDLGFSYDGLAFIDDQQASKLNNVIVLRNDLLLNITGDSVARVCMVPPDLVSSRVNQHVAVIRIDEKKANPHYILYFLKSIKQHLLLISEIGGTRRALTKGMIEDLDIQYPSLSEQKAIAEVLSILDDKIDLLYMQNKTLEAMAETQFRQWFIEKADDDWKEQSLSSIADFLNGVACQSFPPENNVEKLPVLKIKELRNGISDDCDYASTNIDKKYIIKRGDIVFSWSASLMIKIWDGEDCILNQHLFKVKSHKYPQWFVYLWCKQHLAEFISISESHATTMGHIKRKDLDNAKVLIPSVAQLKDMSNLIEPLIGKEIANFAQIRTLNKFRQMLLPKLITGEIEIDHN